MQKKTRLKMQAATRTNVKRNRNCTRETTQLKQEECEIHQSAFRAKSAEKLQDERPMSTSNLTTKSTKLSRARTRRRKLDETRNIEINIHPSEISNIKTTVILVSITALFIISTPPHSSIFLLSSCDQSQQVLSTHQSASPNLDGQISQAAPANATQQASSGQPRHQAPATPLMSALVGEPPTGVGSAQSGVVAAAISASLVMPTTPSAALMQQHQQQQQQHADATNNNNVILIKYANVTSSGKQAGDDVDTNHGQQYESSNNQADPSSQLQIFRLTDGEPLSVSVIQSRFSSSIRVFDVSLNRLKSLPKDLFCPLSNEVRVLNTSFNLLENFDCLGLISQSGQLCLSDLRQLDMSHNLIKHLPATSVATLHNLQVLDLSHNLIDALDELSLSSLVKLSKLSLAHNRLVQLPARIFHKSSSMRLLRLQHNKLELTITSQLLAGLKSLEEIDLSHNNLAQVTEFAFMDKQNLTRVDLSHNQLRTLAQGVLNVSLNPSSTSPLGYQLARSSANVVVGQPSGGGRQRLQHNGQLVPPEHHNHLAPVLQNQNHHQVAAVAAQFYLAQNPFSCDCQLDWLRNLHDLQQQHQHHHHHHHLQQQHTRRTRSSGGNSRLRPPNQASHIFPPNNYQSDQPTVISAPAPPSDDLNNIASLYSDQSSSSNNQYRMGRVADLELVKCQASFKKQQSVQQQHQQLRNRPLQKYLNFQLAAPPGESEAHHWQQLVQVDPSSFLCRYKSHCFALCQCCEFDACDCEMICPPGCHCYYDSTWQTNVIDCSNSNHTSVPDRIPMDVSGLFLDGNQIESLRPSNLIARKSLKSLYLNSSQLQFIANRSFNGLIELESLHLNDNLLTRLQGFEFEPLGQLRALYLQANRLEHIDENSFIYLRSLEVLDLSNNRLTTMPNLDLLSNVGYHNIRMRHLSIAHNWWSCQCELVRKLRDILVKKFLSNGNQVSIDDRAQLRCYHNATTIGPPMLDQHLSPSHSSVAQPFALSGGKQQLTELNGCTDFPIGDDGQLIGADPALIRSNPPQLSNWFGQQSANWPPPPQILGGAHDQPRPRQTTNQNQDLDILFDASSPSSSSPSAPATTSNSFNQNQFGLSADQPMLDPQQNPQLFAGNQLFAGQSQPTPVNAQSQPGPLSSIAFLVVGLLGFLLVGAALFVFVRYQQRHNHAHAPHHFRGASGSHHRRGPKSSTGSTMSSHSHQSSTTDGSSTGIESLGGAGKLRPALNQHLHLHHQAAGNVTTIVPGSTFGINQQLIIDRNQQQHHPGTLHHANLSGTSSQSNIYAALVSSPSSIIGSQQQQQQRHQAAAAPATTTNNNIVYGASQRSQYYAAASNQHQQQHQYASPMETHYNPLVGNVMTSHQPHQAPDSVYGGAKSPNNLVDTPSHCHDELARWGVAAGASTPASRQQSDSPHHSQQRSKVSKFVCKLFSKSFARQALNQVVSVGGSLSASSVGSGGAFVSGLNGAQLGVCSRDELAALASDKIYDAFISYDKRDEPFVMQHISAELECGQPQFRIADRFRDLPLPSSAYMAEAITSVIGCSHRTIVCLTRAYLQNEWCRFELRSAISELATDKSHKIIAIALEPECLSPGELDAEMRALLAAIGFVAPSASSQGRQDSQEQSQLVQLGSPEQSSAQTAPADATSQLVATLTSAGRVVSSKHKQQAAPASQHFAQRAALISYQDRKFWARIKQLMPVARPPTQTFTLTTKN